MRSSFFHPSFRANSRLIPRSSHHGQELCRIFTATDLHTNYPVNMSWVKHLHPTAYKRDILLLPGDVCDDMPTFQQTLSLLSSKFAAIYYTPGNHEAWLKTADKSISGITDSITKLQYLLDYCHNQLPNVHTAPNLVGNSLWIVPLMSWHHQSFDREPDIPGIPAPSPLTVADYAACIFPFQNDNNKDRGPGSLYIAEWFDALNNNKSDDVDVDIWEEIEATRHHTDILSMSHFLPYQNLLPEKRYLTYPNLPKAVGSIPLCNRIQSLVKPDIHVFGHTHFAYDLTLHHHNDDGDGDDSGTTTSGTGTRFIQAPLCAPLERRKRLRTVKFREQDVDDEKEEEEEDAVMAAKWLPLMIYQTMLPIGEVDKQPRYRMNLVDREGIVLNKKRDSMIEDGGEGEGDGALLSSSPIDPPPLEKRVVEYTWPFDGPPITLKHGEAVGQLHADWSAHYAKEGRNAQIMELAPWVKHIWERRLARHARSEEEEHRIV